MLKKYILNVFFLFGASFFIFNNSASAESTLVDHLVISEIQFAGQSAGDEFVELYNPTASPVDISLWSLQYKSVTGSTFYKKNFSDATIISAGGFFLIAHKEYVGSVAPDIMHSSFSLASSGNIFLVSSHDTLETIESALIIDAFSWNDLDVGKSLERKAQENSTSGTMTIGGEDNTLGNGFDSNNDQTDFVLREIPDPQNILSTLEFFEEENHEVTENTENTKEDTEKQSTVNETSSVSYSSGSENSDVIKFNEIFPNPLDEDDEFIELFHTGSIEVNLEGWKIADASNSFLFSKEDFSHLAISPGRWFLISRSISGLSLNNSDETLLLFSPDGIVQDMLSYRDAPEEKSYAKNIDGLWEWTSKRTPNDANEFDLLNHAPVASFEIRGTLLEESELLFDASQSKDEDADTLFFSWNFGDGESCTLSVCHKRYHSGGEYEVRLILYDARGLKDELSSHIEIVGLEKTDTSQIILNTEKTTSSNNNTLVSSSTSASANQTSASVTIPIGSILISAFSPNPEGSDETEWIEIKNAGVSTVDLFGAKLDDSENGSSPYVFPVGTTLPGGQYLVLKKETTKLSLNNTADEARIFDASGNLLSVVSYKDAPEGGILFYENGSYTWKSKENGDTSHAIYYTAQSFENAPQEVLGEEIELFEENISDVVVANHDWPLQTSTIHDAKKMVGEKVIISGKITALPGSWSKQYGYMEDSSGGIQFYFSSGDFSQFSLGDDVRVEGEISLAYGEARIKIKKKEDIKFVGAVYRPPLPTIITSLDENFIDTLVEISGTLLEKRSKEWYISSFGDELRVPIKFSHNESFTSSIQEGDEVRVTGIFRKRNDVLGLWPRGVSDIKHSAELVSVVSVKPDALPLKTEVQDSVLSDVLPQKILHYNTFVSSPLWKYFFGIGSLFFGFLGVFLWQYWRSCKKQKNQV